MRNWLNKPYPFLFETLAVRLRVAASVFLFVFLFLVVFKPFDIEDLLAVNLYLGSLLYGLVSAVVLLITGGLMVRLFPDYFSDKNWTIGRELLHTNTILLAVSVGNGILGHFMELCPPGTVKSIWLDIYQDLTHTYAVGIFPVMALTTISYIIFLRRNLTQVIENNRQIETRVELPEKEDLDKVITVQSTTGNNDFSFRLNDLLFVMSDGNYVEFHLENEGQVRREIRRNTLSNIESQLETYQFLFRSHRAFLVNLRKVVKSSGNAQGYELKFEKTDQVVPVSRKNLTRFDELINS